MRQAAGQSAYEASVIDTIGRLIETGQANWLQACAKCGEPCQRHVDVHVLCETTWKRGKSRAGSWAFALFSILFLPFGWLIALCTLGNSQGESRQLGHVRTVSLPLGTCPEHETHLLQSARAYELQSLLLEVPIYTDLFEEYPQAKVTGARPADRRTYLENSN